MKKTTPKNYLPLKSKNTQLTCELLEQSKAIKISHNMYAPYLPRTIWDAYNNPSATKENIYNKYIEMLSDDYIILKQCIYSYNTFRFTMAFIIEDKQSKFQYLLYVTPTKDYLY